MEPEKKKVTKRMIKKVVNLKPTMHTRLEALQPMRSPMHHNVQKIKSKIRQTHNLKGVSGTTQSLGAHSAMAGPKKKPLYNSTELKAEILMVLEREISHYEIVDRHTKTVVGKAKTLKHASRSIDKRDNAYGGYRFGHRPVYKDDPQPVKEGFLQERKTVMIEHPVHQHRKNVVSRGKKPITFADGTRAFVHPATSHRALERHENLRKPHDKSTFENMLHASLRSFRDAAGV